MTGVMFGGEAVADVPADELGDALRGAVRDLLRGTGALPDGISAEPTATDVTAARS